MLLAYAFESLGQPHVMSLIHPDNSASKRVAEKLGQRVEGETVVLTMPVLIYAVRREQSFAPVVRSLTTAEVTRGDRP